jgi:hypothetical protein
MNNITIDLSNDLALVIPQDDAGNPQPIQFTRIDITQPGCLVFYKKVHEGEEIIVNVVPWSSINIVYFQNF